MGLFGSKKTGKNAKENKKENPLNVPKTAQDSIPYQGVYENGIIQINENLFSKMYVIPDINFTFLQKKSGREVKLSKDERVMLEHYRMRPQMQDAVRKILEMPDPAK